MNRWLLLLLLFLGIGLTGCSSEAESMSGEKPPKTVVKIGNETYATVLGSYCWKNMCADTVGPHKLLEGKDPIKVNRGEKITIVMNYNPQPNEIYLGKMDNENDDTEVKMENNRFTAPTEEGIYYYIYSVFWMDEKEANVSHGDAYYAFSIEVN
ncbi:hypothetical protein JSQ81_10335 [Sporosarcina sp. Marseille-Q4063]|uniref:hypothetical protein n=1 Tax=Sporosarcina sp. Marseille-Q4063 TaxID=2810514 RepID=UPI001BB0C2D5|nr:hypothetical protein [Sporosarcina sp. Marseille-Q4063]QUW20277.1 hypothetical protein JSQ81_10335 [Sporosarcina sp. Marseille-Q4063]